MQDFHQFHQIFNHNGEHHGPVSPVTNTLPTDPSPMPALNEHTAGQYLVKYADVTIYSVKSECWCEPSMWNLGRIPNANDRVCVLAGHEVTIDHMGAECLTLRNDGEITFIDKVNSWLKVETFINFGSLEADISADFTSHIMFRDTGPLNPVTDPLLQARGLVSSGSVKVKGAFKTAFGKFQTVLANSKKVTLLSAPVNWRKGDVLIFPSTNIEAMEDETVKVTKVVGKTVYFEPALKFAHKVQVTSSPRMTRPSVSKFIDATVDGLGKIISSLAAAKRAILGGALVVPFPVTFYDTTKKQFVCVANMTRNIVWESENKETKLRGHTMFMGAINEHSFIEFKNLGRTDKSTILIDTPNEYGFESSNARARYSHHFHRVGTEPGMLAAIVIGCVVWTSPGWGFVNHSSRVNFIDCIAYDCLGAGFASEIGNECGQFLNNLGIRFRGSGIRDDDRPRMSVFDFGHSGFFIWMQGPGIHTEGNFGYGAASAAYGLSNVAHNREGGDKWNHYAANTPDPSIYSPEEVMIERQWVSWSLKNNQAGACNSVLETWRVGHQLFPLRVGQVRFAEGFVGWGGSGNQYVDLNYSADITFRNCWFYGNGGWMMAGDDNAPNRTFEDCRIENFGVGVQWYPGLMRVVRGYWANRVNFMCIGVPWESWAWNTEVIAPILAGDIDFESDSRGQHYSPDTRIRYNGRRIYFFNDIPVDKIAVTKDLRLNRMVELLK